MKPQMTSRRLGFAAAIFGLLAGAGPAIAQDVLPFPTPPMGGYTGGVSLFAVDGTLYYEYSALLLKRNKIEVGKLPAGDVKIALEMRTPVERAAPAELKFWINGQDAVEGTVQRTIPAGFTGAESFDVGMDLLSPVADAYFDEAPFAFNGTIEEMHVKYTD